MSKYKKINIGSRSIFCQNKGISKGVYNQVKKYFDFNFPIKKNDIILDVGANIGLFSIYLLDQINKNVQIFAFEPSPITFDILSKNLSKEQNVKLYNFGISDKTAKTNITHYINTTALSTFYPYDKNSIENMKETLIKLLNTPNTDYYKYRWLLFIPFKRKIIGKLVESLFQSVELECEMSTLSNFIHKEKIKRINLLKIDAEKSELDILNGINSQHWKIIDKILIEVHNQDNRLNIIINKLKKNGFINITSIEDLNISNQESVFLIFASKDKLK